MARTSTRTPSAAQIEAARKLLLAAGDPDTVKAEQRRQAAAQKEALQTVVTPAFVSQFLDITGGVQTSSKTPEPGKTAWVGASAQGIPVETPDGGKYTVRVIVTQVQAPA